MAASSITKNNVWIGGNGDGVVQKYSHDGHLLLQIGTKFLCDSANGVCAGDSPSEGFSRPLLHVRRISPWIPTLIRKRENAQRVCRGTATAAIAWWDRRRGNYLRQMGGVGTGAGQFAPGGGGHPHCVVLGRTGSCMRAIAPTSGFNVYQRTAPSYGPFLSSWHGCARHGRLGVGR